MAFTANSTKEVSKNILLKIAKDKNKEITIVNCDCSTSWKYYENNDFANYEKSIAQNILKIEKEVEVVFLAQASMEGVKESLSDFTKEIYSSPKFGVQEYLKDLVI